MDDEFSSLETKITSVVEICRQLREENDKLREQIAEADGEKKRMAETIEIARGRLESLLSQMPQS